MILQTLWGPGIAKEPSYTALGGGSNEPSTVSIGLISPTRLYDFAMQSALRKSKPSVPKDCVPPPANLPASARQTCLTLLLQLLTSDPVPNVRFAAARALVIISANLDAK